MFSLNTFILQIAITFLVGLESVFSEVETAYCYSEDKDPYVYTGTRTPYHFVHGTIQDPNVPNCEPMQIWMLSRHGTRYPTGQEIVDMVWDLKRLQKNIIVNHEQLGSVSLCPADFENLKAWSLDPNLNSELSKRLTKQGENDLESLGMRLKSYFPNILQADSPDKIAKKYKFRSTSTQRTTGSMDHFIKGLFGNPSAAPSEIVQTADDVLLKVYATCKPWLAEMNKTSVNYEFETFLNGTEFKTLISDVSRRLGFSHNLTLESVWLMYKACSFGKAWEVNELSPWCAVFTKDELQIFEYEDDLFSYYHTSYGQKMSNAIGCLPLQDMFDHFSKLENKDASEEPKGIFYFSHSASLQLLYTVLGIAKDKIPLTALNFREMGDRKWRISFLSPFAANFVAVFYKCDSSHKVRFYLSEKLLEYEGCDKGLCDWNYLKEKLGSVASNCKVDFCYS